MTEKEAVERLKYDLAMITFNPMTGGRIPLWLLSEDEQGLYNACEMAIKALEEIQQYRAIGTVEECREAAEKQKPKKIEYEGFSSQDGFTHYRMGKCPNCDRWYRNTDDIMYCSGCGVRLDWSDEE